MALTIQERLKDLRVERGLTLEQLAGETGLSKSALGSYESEDYKMSRLNVQKILYKNVQLVCLL